MEHILTGTAGKGFQLSTAHIVLRGIGSSIAPEAGSEQCQHYGYSVYTYHKKKPPKRPK